MSQENYICSFCKKEFKTKYTLKSHVDKNKKCMINRGQEPVSEFVCEKCNYVTMFKNDLVKHVNICKVSKKNENNSDLLQELKEQIIELRKQLKEKDQIIKDLAEKAIENSKTSVYNTTNTTNNIVNNLKVISEEYIKDNAKNLTLEHIKKGAVGYSEYFLEYPLKERITCTDFSRRKIKYKNENGEIVSDPEMTLLSNLLFKSIKEKNRELTIQYTNELTDKMNKTKDSFQLEYFMNIISKFTEQDIEIFKMFNGDKNDFFHDILRNICCKTIK